MTELHTAVFLGLYVLLAGLYGLAYAASRVLRSSTIGKAASILFGSHVLVLLVIIIWMPLAIGWKAILCASSVLLMFVPPFVWRLIEETHGEAS